MAIVVQLNTVCQRKPFLQGFLSTVSLLPISVDATTTYFGNLALRSRFLNVLLILFPPADGSLCLVLQHVLGLPSLHGCNDHHACVHGVPGICNHLSHSNVTDCSCGWPIDPSHRTCQLRGRGRYGDCPATGPFLPWYPFFQVFFPSCPSHPFNRRRYRFPRRTRCAT